MFVINFPLKHNGSCIIMWDSFSRNGIRPLYQICKIMDKFKYADILETQMLPYVLEKVPNNWTFQQDNDPKHFPFCKKLVNAKGNSCNGVAISKCRSKSN